MQRRLPTPFRVLLMLPATGGNPEIVAAGVNGRLVPPGDIKALADAIATHTEDAQLRREHGRASRAPNPSIRSRGC